MIIRPWEFVKNWLIDPAYNGVRHFNPGSMKLSAYHAA